MDYSSAQGSLDAEDKKLLMQVMTEEIEDLSDETYTANCVMGEEVENIKQEDHVLTKLKKLDEKHGTQYLNNHARFGGSPTRVR